MQEPVFTYLSGYKGSKKFASRVSFVLYYKLRYPKEEDTF